MRSKGVVPLMALVAALAHPAAAQDTSTAPEPASHPPEVALMDEGEAGSVYRQTAQSLRLYTHDPDPVGQSTCNGGCAWAWPPLRAPANATPVGQWSVVARQDGTRQWAYNGKPVYTRFHDAPDQATGVGIEGWRLIPYMSKVDSQITRAEAVAATAALWDVIDANHDGVLDVGDRDVQRGAAFARVDRNNDGELSKAELGSSSREFSSGQAQARAAWFARIDTDGSGALSRAELAAGGADVARGERSREARYLFRLADADRDSKVSRSEFDAAIERQLKLFDTNSDGKITTTEHEAGRERLRRESEASPAAN